jgi:branched-chain amino acid transport system permease protein
VRSPGWLICRTPFGRVVRAGVQNPDMVGALGISLQPYMTAIAALGVGLAGLAACCSRRSSPSCIRRWAPRSSPRLRRGGDRRARLVLGRGRGRAAGRRGARHHHLFPAAGGEASMYLLMVLVLLLRPRGLFGERIQKFE